MLIFSPLLEKNKFSFFFGLACELVTWVINCPKQLRLCPVLGLYQGQGKRHFISPKGSVIPFPVIVPGCHLASTLKVNQHRKEVMSLSPFHGDAPERVYL